MYIDQAKDLIKNMIEKDVRIPTFLVGTMGIGKSKIFEQIAEELDVSLVDLRLSQQEPSDLIGVPRSNKDENKTVWLKPGWWPEPGTRGIVFLDEVNRAPIDVRQAVFQLVLDRRLHTHQLPDGWYVHAAGNPDNSNYQVETLDPAMVRRFLCLKISPNVDSWAKYWHSTYQDEYADILSKFVLSHKDNALAPNEQYELGAKPTPDGYRMVWEMMTSGAIPPGLEQEVISGIIGQEMSIALLKFQDSKYKKPIGAAEILDHYTDKSKGLKKKILEQPNDHMYVTIHNVIAVLQAIDSDEERKKNFKTEQYVNLKQFIIDIRDEDRATVVFKLPDFFVHKMGEYPDLIAAVRKVRNELERK